MNASDDRGIDTVRNEIKLFAGAKSFSKLPKLVILDECDSMIKEAQFALRRSMESKHFISYSPASFSLLVFFFFPFLGFSLVIEMYSSNARFCLICNYVNRIIPALQSRCTKMRFCPLDPTTALDRIKMIVEKEQFSAFFPQSIHISLSTLAHIHSLHFLKNKQTNTYFDFL